MQTWKLDEWDAAGDVTFVFGADARKPMVARAESMPATAWRRLARPPRFEGKTEPRGRRDPVQEEIVCEKGFKHFVLRWEDGAEFKHRPDRCRRCYRLAVLRQRISVERGPRNLFQE